MGCPTLQPGCPPSQPKFKSRPGPSLLSWSSGWTSSRLPLFPLLPQDQVPRPDQGPPHVQVLRVLPMADQESHHTGKASVWEVQGRGTLWSLGSLEQRWPVYPPRLLEHHPAHKGTVDSLLTNCPCLTTTRLVLEEYNSNLIQAHPYVLQLYNLCLAQNAVQFWLDCSTMPPVIKAVQVYGDVILETLFRMTRNFCHGLHKARMSMLSEMSESHAYS